MVMVDIYVPALDMEYNFNLEQNVKISTIIEEIGEMIAHKEQSEIDGDMEELLLCDKEKGRVLSVEHTLDECGIQTGSKLILI